MTEDFKDSDIQEIILNYRQHKVFKFQIAGKLIFDNQKFVRGHKFYYSIDQDSLLTHIYKKQKYNFIIRNTEFIYLESEVEKSLQSKNKYLIEYDSARTNFTKFYKINNNDTIISSYFKETKDSLNRIIESINWNYLDSKYCRKHLYTYNSDTTTETYFNYEHGKWCLDYEVQIIEKKIEVFSLNKVRIYTNGNYRRISNNPKENYTHDYQVTRTINYYKNQCIKNITTEVKVFNWSHENSSNSKTVTRLKVKQVLK